jgi:peptidoglycan/LPS O-acetylase OafA/YrhL
LGGEPKRGIGYVPALDGLRGAAIIAVMLFHAGAGRFPRGGFLGVDVFFVLSGFLITAILLEEHRSRGSIDLARFYLRRVLRLAPALVAMLVLVVSLSFVALDGASARSNVVDAFITLLYSANWARVFHVHPPNLFFAHTWSLSIEEQFYVLWPPIAAASLRRGRRARNVALASAIGAAFACALRFELARRGASIDRLYNSLDMRADALLVGCAAGAVLAPGVVEERVRLRIAAAAAPIAALGLLVACFSASWLSVSYYVWGLPLIELAAASVIVDAVLSVRPTTVKRILEGRLLVKIGAISYGLYLWHFPINAALRMVGFRWAGVLIVGSVVTVALASLSYRVVELPFLERKRRLAATAAPGATGSSTFAALSETSR